MSDRLDLQLNAFEHRLRGLESELADLRRLATATREATPAEPVTAPVLIEPTAPSQPATPLAPWIEEQLGAVGEFVAAGNLNGALKMLDTARRRAVSRRDVAALQAIVDQTEAIGRGAPRAVEAKAARLAYSTTQNLRYLSRQLGMQTQAGPATPARPARPSTHAQAATPAPAPTPREPLFTLPQISTADLLGATALAIAGGVVTLLGIVFFFVLAVNRGWIGPVGRVGLGAAASALVFVGGFELRRRYRDTHAALAAVGVGIAGGFVTLLAAAALYDLLSDTAALVVCAAIAATAVATSLVWRSQLVAGFGLIGAMLVPLAVVAQSGLTVLGTAFVAIVFAATAVVALRYRWRDLLVAGSAVSLPQIGVLAAQAEYHAQAPWRIVLLVAIFAALYLAAGIVYQLRFEGQALQQVSTSLITTAGLLAAAGVVRLYGDIVDEGVALLVAATVYGTLAAVLFPRASRDLSAYLAAIALTLAAISLADLLTGQALAYAWTAEAAALAWLSRRVRELRYQVWAALYLVLGLSHVLIVDAPPTHWFVASDNPASGAVTAAALAVALIVFDLYTGPWPDRLESRGGLFSLLEPALRAFASAQELMSSIARWSAAVLATYTTSLGILALFTSFAWGHVAVAALLSALGLAIVLAGLHRTSFHLTLGGYAWLGATAGIVAINGEAELSVVPRSWSFLVVAAALTAAAHAYQQRGDTPSAVLELLSVLLIVAGLGLSVDAVVELLRGRTGAVDPLDSALLGLAALYVAAAASVFRCERRRDYRTLLWAIGLVLGSFAASKLVSGTYLVLAWAAAGVALTWLSARTSEQRFQVGAGVLIALATIRALAVQIPPTHLFQAHLHPAAGSLAVFVVVAALAASAHYLDTQDTRSREQHLSMSWLAGVLGVFGLSLGILDLAEGAFPGASLHTSFQRGQTVVSAFWALLGLALLYAGLKRWHGMRLAGFAVLATSLAKIFLFDLPSLSSITRALSFLTVGGVLLLGGFFYQRLGSKQQDLEPEARGTT